MKTKQNNLQKIDFILYAKQFSFFMLPSPKNILNINYYLFLQLSTLYLEIFGKMKKDTPKCIYKYLIFILC